MKNKFIRFELQKEDADLIGWKNSLPTESFSETVNKILVIETQGRIARIPCGFSSTEVTEDVKTGFYVHDQNVLAFLGSIKKGERTNELKKILRKHIEVNRRNPPALVNLELFHRVLTSFRTKIEAKEAEHQGQPDKYRKLCASYDLGTKMLFEAVIACYESGDEKLGDRELRNLDVDKIASDAFAENFGQQNFISDEDDEYMTDEYREMLENLSGKRSMS